MFEAFKKYFHSLFHKELSTVSPISTTWSPTYTRQKLTPAFSAYNSPFAFAGMVGAQYGEHVSVPRLKLPLRSTQEQRPASAPSGPHVNVSVLPDLPTRPAYNGGRRTISLAENHVRMQPMQVGVGWNAGYVRCNEPNEDSVAALQGTYSYHGMLLPFSLFVVADGMGGHDCGLEASRLAMQSMTHTVLQNMVMGDEMSDEFFIDMLIGGVDWANRTIVQRSQIEGIDMGTTLTAALVVNSKAFIVNVGDSRTYHYSDQTGLTQVTRDHSLVASLVNMGQISPEEVYTHPERNKVYRCVGQQEDLQVDFFMIRELQANDMLLLCSDGLWEMVHDPVIERAIRSSDNPEAISTRLVQAALRGGGVDNISVIVAKMP
jgi:serine/threonine protein phosphatase PrpC